MKSLSSEQAARYARQIESALLFQGLCAREIAPLLLREGIYFTRYPAGEIIVSAQSAQNRLGVLLRGSAVVYKRSGEGLLRMSELQPCAMFGMAALFAEETAYPTEVRAEMNSAAILITEDALRGLFREDMRIVENYLRLLTSRIHFLNTRIEGLIRPNAKEHVALYIRQNAKDGEMKQSLSVMAQALNMSRATLYRSLDALEAEGVIRRQGRAIHIQQTES